MERRNSNTIFELTGRQNLPDIRNAPKTANVAKIHRQTEAWKWFIFYRENNLYTAKRGLLVYAVCKTKKQTTDADGEQPDNGMDDEGMQEIIKIFK